MAQGIDHQIAEHLIQPADVGAHHQRAGKIIRLRPFYTADRLIGVNGIGPAAGHQGPATGS
jgi:hypothetical protein